MGCMTQPRLVSIVANGVMADFAFFVPYIYKGKSDNLFRLPLSSYRTL